MNPNIKKTNRIRLAGLIAQNLTTEQSVLLEALQDDGAVRVTEFKDTQIAMWSLLPIAGSLVALGHHIYTEVELDEQGREIEESRIFHMDDCSFITERRLGMPEAVTVPDANIDFVA
ncbi:MAG: hypothetical protein COA63_009615 [Methylophaga sp.]|nr:hypothetical protein [Methylophaga sp.]